MSHDGSGALTQALATVAHKYHATHTYPFGHDGAPTPTFEACFMPACELARAALAGAAPDPYEELGFEARANVAAGAAPTPPLDVVLNRVSEECAYEGIEDEKVDRVVAKIREWAGRAASEAPTLPLAPETGDLDTKVGPNQCPVFILAPGPISYHCTSTPDHDGWHEVMIDNEGVAAILAASRGASEGSRGAAPTPPPQERPPLDADSIEVLVHLWEQDEGRGLGFGTLRALVRHYKRLAESRGAPLNQDGGKRL